MRPSGFADPRCAPRWWAAASKGHHIEALAHSQRSLACVDANRSDASASVNAHTLLVSTEHTSLIPTLRTSITSARAHEERWRLRQPFVISRETFTAVVVVVVELGDGTFTGRGECCPVAHYGESPNSVLKDIEPVLAALRAGTAWNQLHDRVPAGAARNAIDCAVWDLAAKQRKARIWTLIGAPEPKPVETVYTISLNEAAVMAESAQAAQNHDILKLKLGAPGDAERVKAIRRAVPNKRLIADINEAWSPSNLGKNLEAMAEASILMVEQPLRAGADSVLATLPRPVPIGADESCHVAADVDRLIGRYDLVNIKLDKTGGLTEALRLLDQAQRAGLGTMVGCMLGTSLAMAPGVLLAQRCQFVDLDAPLLIGSDRDAALKYDHGLVYPPTDALWG